MREQALPFHSRWATRPGVVSARFIYLAGLGRTWRVHASVNGTGGQGPQVLMHRYFREQSAALAAVEQLMSDSGVGPDDWQAFGRAAG